VTFGVPSLPSLEGASAFWQAGIGTPLQLSNLEVTELTGW
jgi:hypothetical protein